MKNIVKLEVNFEDNGFLVLKLSSTKEKKALIKPV